MAESGPCSFSRVMMAGMLVFFYFLPALSPRHFQVGTFRSTYLYIMVLVVGLFAYMDARLLYRVKSNRGEPAYHRSGPGVLREACFCFLDLMGAVIGKVRRNFYIGVRVPWTLAGDRVWNDTHRLAGKDMGHRRRDRVCDDSCSVPPFCRPCRAHLSAFIPVIYSFVHYKSLERQAAL